MKFQKTIIQQKYSPHLLFMWPTETAVEFSYSSILSDTIFFVWTPWMEILLLLLLCLPMKAPTASFISLRFVIPNSYFIYPLQSLIFFNESIYFNWRIISLQYCDFFAIHWHESAMGIHVSTRLPSWSPLQPPSPPYPSALSQSPGFGCPASYIELALVIYFIYGKIHVSMLFSQIIPPLPSPTDSKSLFFTSASLFRPYM